MDDLYAFTYFLKRKGKFTYENKVNPRFKDTCSANILVTNIFKDVFATDTFLKIYGSDVNCKRSWNTINFNMNGINFEYSEASTT